MTLTWEALDDADLPALRDLAQACLDADGGLPILTADGLLRSRLLGGETRGTRDGNGALLAAAGVAVDGGTASTSGMVRPAARGQGIGRELMRWAVDRAGPATLTVATETCAPAAERLYARFGLVESFAEVVMRHPLAEVPPVPAPDGVTVAPVADSSPHDLFAAYVGSFADRPGFPDPTEAEWLGELEEDDDWRSDLSAVALDADRNPAGFVNVLDTWIDQVGVVPAWRGRGLGAHLVSRSLQALAAEGASEAWLTVNVNNPAGDLYTRLGFETYGKRARFSAPTR